MENVTENIASIDGFFLQLMCSQRPRKYEQQKKTEEEEQESKSELFRRQMVDHDTNGFREKDFIQKKKKAFSGLEGQTKNDTTPQAEVA